MPSSRGIDMSLESQFDIMTIPEFPLTGRVPSPRSSGEEHGAHTLRPRLSIDLSQPRAQLQTGDKADKVVDVYVPSYAASQFWIVYNVSPLSLPLAPDRTRFMFFRLVLGGKCVVSWGIGEEHGWKGKTMWAFYRGEDGGHGWRTIEKKGFFFQGAERDQEFEIQVFRARGRRRASRELGERVPKGDKDFDLVNFGRLKEHHPQRFYQYALQDPHDEPYVVFRYHLRTWVHLKELGLATRSRSGSSSSSINSDHSTTHESSKLEDADDFQGPIIHARRLSVPPSIRLVPTTTGTEPMSPMKIDSESETAIGGDCDSRPADTVMQRKWVVRTPSPFKMDWGNTED